jgi:glutathione synthase/RimK-type ligase-like ATP-grasp enzyme
VAIKQSSIAVLTDSKDSHIQFVQRHLALPFVILEPAAGALAGHEYGYKLLEGKFAFMQNGHPVKNISAIWNRRSTVPMREELPLPPHLQNYSYTALENFEHFLWTRFSDALWVSEPHAMLRASDKLLQLETAAKMGFKIPKTLVTSSSKVAKEFIKSNGETITKVVGVRYFRDASGGRKVVLTRRVKESDDFAGLNVAPAFFQQAIDPQEDIRVTVVGSKVFAAAIRVGQHHDVSASVRDWRLASFEENMDIVIFDLPAKIARLCQQHVRQLGLVYGAIDLILDKKGKFWFLENNPDGQWAFVEEVTAQPIGKAVADLLTTHK